MALFNSFGKRFIAFSAVLPLAWLGYSPGLASAAPTDALSIDIAAVNDFHGRIRAEGEAAGAAVVACAINQMRAANPNSIFVSAGDNIGATTFESSVAKDQPTIDILNRMGLEVSALGNHEFDKGDADVDGRVIKAAKWKYTAANIFRAGKPAYQQYDIVERSGLRVAFIGAVTEELPQLAGISKDLELRDMTDSVNAVVDKLSDGDTANDEADVFVVLVHDGAPSADLAGAANTAYGKLITKVNPKVSAVISGHTHQFYAQQVNGIWVTQSAQYGEQLGRLTLKWDPATRKASVEKAWNQDLMTGGKPFCPGDRDVQALVDQAVTASDELGKAPIGSIAADLLRGAAGSRGTESTIGNFIADVQLWAARRTTGADVAVINAGSIRTDLLYQPSGTEGPGVVTFKEAAAVQPFANSIMTTQLTGVQLRTLLEQQWQPAGSSRPFLKLGTSANLTYTFDPEAPVGRRITQVTMNGVVVKDNDKVTVAGNSFIMQGRDGYFVLAEGTKPVDTGWVDLDAMVEYFKQVSPVGATTKAGPARLQRSVGATFRSGADRVYRPGDELAVDLWGLSYTNSEPKPTAVSVVANGTNLGSFPVNNTFVDTFDLTGRASIRLKLPADLVSLSSGQGAGKIVITDDVNGKLFSLRFDSSGGSVIPTPSPSGPVPVTSDPAGDPTKQTVRPLPVTGSADESGIAAVLGLIFVAVAAGYRNRSSR